MFNYQFKVSSLLVIIFVFKIVYGSKNNDISITLEEKLKLDKFKEQMSRIVPHEYMKEEIYLIRWLRARNFDLDAAEEMLITNLKWREKEKIDTILTEDWDSFDRRYRYWRHSLAKNGQPVGYMGFGSWDVRRAIIAGDSAKLSRYLDSSFERMCNKPRHIRENSENKNITQVSMIVDMSGFSLTQQGCLSCISTYIRFISNYESYFPGCADKMIILNTPAAFEAVLNAMRPFMSKSTRESLQVYGTNKSVWQPVLFSFIDKNQLPPEVGGTKDYED